MAEEEAEDSLAPHIQSFFSAFGTVNRGKKSLDASSDYVEPGNGRPNPPAVWAESFSSVPESGPYRYTPSPVGSIQPPRNGTPGDQGSRDAPQSSRFWFANENPSPPPVVQGLAQPSDRPSASSPQNLWQNDGPSPVPPPAQSGQNASAVDGIWVQTASPVMSAGRGNASDPPMPQQLDEYLHRMLFSQNMRGPGPANSGDGSFSGGPDDRSDYTMGRMGFGPRPPPPGVANVNSAPLLLHHQAAPPQPPRNGPMVIPGPGHPGHNAQQFPMAGYVSPHYDQPPPPPPPPQQVQQYYPHHPHHQPQQVHEMQSGGGPGLPQYASAPSLRGFGGGGDATERSGVRALEEQLTRALRFNNGGGGNDGSESDMRRGPGSGRDDDDLDMDRLRRAPKPLPEISPYRKLEIEVQIQEVLARLEPTPQELLHREKLLQAIDGLVKKEWPEAYVKLYGSSGNQFGLRGADVDMCLFLTLGPDDTNASIIARLGELIESDGHQDVFPLPDTRVPIVKFKERGTGAPVDICLNNYLAVNNTEFLATYGQVDRRLVQLSRFVKFWAKRRKINEPYLGTLSSYAYVLLCIYYLQMRPVPVLPNLQTLPPPGQQECPEVLIGDFDCYYDKDLEYIYSIGYGPRAQNHESLAELLVGFFHYFAYNFDYHEHVVCVRKATLLTKEKKEWTLKHNTRHNRYWLCIEDPFESSHNLGRVADRNTLYDIRGEFMRAYRIFNNGGTIDELCQPYEASPDDASGGRRDPRDSRDSRSPKPRSPRPKPGKGPQSTSPLPRARTTSNSSDSPHMRVRTFSRSSDGDRQMAHSLAAPPPMGMSSMQPPQQQLGPRPKNPINRKPGQHSSHRQYRDPSAKAYQKNTTGLG